MARPDVDRKQWETKKAKGVWGGGGGLRAHRSRGEPLGHKTTFIVNDDLLNNWEAKLCEGHSSQLLRSMTGKYGSEAKLVLGEWMLYSASGAQSWGATLGSKTQLGAENALLNDRGTKLKANLS